MKLVKLYIENFICHENSFIDFSQFSSALIVGKANNNDLVSNGVGKTTIFRAIEYVLFNQADDNLEKLIRDDTNACKIVLDFVIDNDEYRVSRTRTRKGATDLSLFQRSANIGTDEEVYHTIDLDEKYTPITDKKFWKDISGRRAADTEKDLSKLIKLNFKSFRNTIHFLQHDFAGLTTATPEKRKGILKDALDLIVYSKLEKIAKEQSGALSKDIEKYKILIENLFDPNKEILNLNKQLEDLNHKLIIKNDDLLKASNQTIDQNTLLNELLNQHSNLEKKFSSLIDKEKILNSEKSRIETSVKEYTSKKYNAIKSAKDLINELNELKDNQLKLIELDYCQIDILAEQVSLYKDKIAQFTANINKDLETLEELKVPMPNKNICRDCRQPITEKHKKECKAKIDKEIEELQNNIKEYKKSTSILNEKIITDQQTINSLNFSKQQLEKINTSISIKNKEIIDKKSSHEEYVVLFNKFNNDLSEKIKEIEENAIQLKASSLKEANKIKIEIDKLSKELDFSIKNRKKIEQEINTINETKAIVHHNKKQKEQDAKKIIEYQKELIKLEESYSTYPSVLQAFSSVGIPNLIIQNVLDDLQIEANNLLSQLKPGLQLSFFVEKTKADGSEADTLDIKYHINGKERYYALLSGAQQLSATFSLKLGLSFLLQKMIGTDVKFLLLDEVDQSLDKASIDAFVDIIKFFQKDFTILVITHNDRLKDRFQNAILVEQDINMVSRAKVVSSW